MKKCPEKNPFLNLRSNLKSFNNMMNLKEKSESFRILIDSYLSGVDHLLFLFGSNDAISKTRVATNAACSPYNYELFNLK